MLELYECSLIASNYLLSQTASNCGDARGKRWLLNNILCLQEDSIRCLNEEI